MKLTVFGPTGQVGSEVVRQALAAGHEVRAYARRDEGIPSAATKIIAELDDEAALRRAIAGADAVISALGARKNTADHVALFGDALARIGKVMSEVGVRRLVSISGAAVWLADDPPDFGRRIATVLMALFAKHVLAAKRREHDVVTATDLEWVLVRPGRIVRGEPTGKIRASLMSLPSTSITSGDVAQFAIGAASGTEWSRKAPLIG